jgi:hypothetical protein
MLFFGSFLYITVLLINAVAILSEDRFLARSTKPPPHHCRTDFQSCLEESDS